jgi:hypothetical protein
MTDPKSLGEDLGTTKKEATRNEGRIKPNFPYSQRVVDDTNMFNVYRSEFNMNEGTTASLDMHIKERPEPCTVNPPDINCVWSGVWIGDYVAGACHGFNETGMLINWRYSKETSNTGDYLVAGGKVIIPYDGCYLVEARWGGAGFSYFELSDGIHMDVIKSGPSGTISLGSADMTTTGFIWTLGPQIWYTPAPSRFLKMIEAKAGDSIYLRGSGGGFNKCYDWFGTHLRGMAMYLGDGATLTVTLIALAEDVVLTNKDGSPGTTPKPTDPPTPPDSSEKAKQCALGNTNLAILNDLLSFYTNLTNKGQLPYPNQSWTSEENWSAFWADYWSRLGWTSNTGEYPYPAPQNSNELRAYQIAETARLEGCPTQEEIYVPCDMYYPIGNQLQLLKDYYYSSPVFPIYIDISGSTEPTFFDTWPEFWAWVWDRGYSMETHAYDMELVWTEARNTYTSGTTPWPPATTIGEIDAYITQYESLRVGCYNG